MPNIIKGSEIVADDWKVLDKDTVPICGYV